MRTNVIAKDERDCIKNAQKIHTYTGNKAAHERYRKADEQARESEKEMRGGKRTNVTVERGGRSLKLMMTETECKNVLYTPRMCS